ERDAAEGQALAKGGRTRSGDKREEYGGAQGQRGSGVGVARQKKKQSKAKLQGGRSGKPVGRNGGVAITKDRCGAETTGYGGASSRRHHECDWGEQASVNRHTSW
ncbi:unnamed protein product, partial [Pylaiella littoralis]